MDIRRVEFGRMGDGRAVHLYTLVNSNGVEARITNFGGVIVSLKVPDREEMMDDVVLGHDALMEYVNDQNYFGCIVGRYANRIAGGRFSIGGVECSLARNSGGHHLHGGVRGFNKVLWDAEATDGGGGAGLSLRYLSRDGEEGYPGNLSVQVSYLLTDRDELRIDYEAETDRETVVNLTNHSYFNLAGAGAGDVLGHVLTVHAETFTPVDAGLIPTGELRSVEGTPLDFRKPAEIGARIDDVCEQLFFGSGYDHNYVLGGGGGTLALATEVYEPASGRVMRAHTTEPGVQLYTGNHLGDVLGKGDMVYRRRGGLCLEAQHFPDSPNKPGFPSTVLRSGETYRQTTVYAFSVKHR